MNIYNDNDHKIKAEHDDEDYIGIDINELDQDYTMGLDSHSHPHKKNPPYDDHQKRSSAPSESNKEKTKESKTSSYPLDRLEKRPKDIPDKEKSSKNLENLKLNESSMKSSSKHLTQTKKDQNIDIRSKRLPSESLGRHKEDRDRIAQWEKKLRYRESDDSEFCVHFYIQNVFLSPNRKIDEFLSSVRDRINKAGVCEFVQIVNYYDKEVKLSVGMKYDQDALDILNHKRMILLYNREQKLYETKPIISSVFETYCLAKKAAGGGDSSTRTKNEKTFEKKQNSSSSHSKSNSRRKRKSSVESRKKESGNQNLVRRSNYEKNLIKLDKRYRSKSNSRSSMRNRDDPAKKNKYQHKTEFHYNKTRKSMSSHSRSHKGKTHGQSRSRSRYRSYSKYEKKYPKQQIMPFKEEKTAILEQVPLTNPNASLYSAGNMPSIVDNNSSNLINMAYVMNQQLVQGSQPFENKPEFVQYAHHHLASANLTLAPNTQFSQELLADKNKKDSSELLMANNLANTNINSSENNLEGSFGHVAGANNNNVSLNTVVKTSSKNITITNNGSKKVININNRKKDTSMNAIQTSNIQNETVSSDCICYLLGIPQSFTVNEVLFAIKQMNSDIEKISSKEELEKNIIDPPIECLWEQSFDMEYLKIIFPNTKSTDNLIINSLKIMQNSIIVLPNFPNKPLIDLLDYHEIRVITLPKIDQLFIYQSFSAYGDIVNIIEEPNTNGSSFIIIYAHHNSVKRVNPTPHPQQNFQMQLENGEMINIFIQRIDKPIPVKRPAANETIAARFNYNTINMIQQSHQKNEYKNIPANINSQSIKVSNESKKPEEIIVKEKIELKREKNDSPITKTRNYHNPKQEKNSNYKNYHRNNYSQSPQNYKQKGGYQQQDNNNNNNRSNYRYNNTNNSNSNFSNNNTRDNYHNNREYSNNNNNNQQRKNFSNSNRNDNYNKYGSSGNKDKYYENNNSSNRNYQNRRNNNY